MLKGGAVSPVCPHCGRFAMIKTQAQLDDHLWNVHHEGWPEPAPADLTLELARRYQAHLWKADDREVIDAGNGDCDDCGRLGMRQRIGRFDVCAVCARARLHAKELAA